MNPDLIRGLVARKRFGGSDGCGVRLLPACKERRTSRGPGDSYPSFLQLLIPWSSSRQGSRHRASETWTPMSRDIRAVAIWPQGNATDQRFSSRACGSTCRDRRASSTTFDQRPAIWALRHDVPRAAPPWRRLVVVEPSPLRQFNSPASCAIVRPIIAGRAKRRAGLRCSIRLAPLSSWSLGASLSCHRGCPIPSARLSTMAAEGFGLAAPPRPSGPSGDV